MRWVHKKRATLRVRHLEGKPPGPPYPEVVKRVRTLTQQRTGKILGDRAPKSRTSFPFGLGQPFRTPTGYAANRVGGFRSSLG